MGLFTKCRALVFSLGAISLLVVPTVAQDSRHGYYTAPALDAVRPIMAKNGMVVAQERIAAGIGRDILARGGRNLNSQIEWGFQQATGRRPENDELQLLIDLLKIGAHQSAELRIWATCINKR